MELKELEAIIEKGIDAKELRFICQLRTYIALDKQIFYHTKKRADNYEYLIAIPIFWKDGFRQPKEMLLYGKLKKSK